MSVYWIKYRGTRFPVRRGETILGRSPYSSIVISNSLVSREHCALRLTSDGLQIIDLESTNGTTVDGERIRGATHLKPGSIIGVGTDVLEVVVVEGRRNEDDSTRRELEPHVPSSLPGTERNPDTKTTKVTLNLIEALVASASESGRPTAVAGPIQRSVEDLLDAAKKNTPAFEEGDRARIERVLDQVCDWHTDRSLDVWRSRMRETIASLAQ